MRLLLAFERGGEGEELIAHLGDQLGLGRGEGGIGRGRVGRGEAIAELADLLARDGPLTPLRFQRRLTALDLLAQIRAPRAPAVDIAGKVVPLGLDVAERDLEPLELDRAFGPLRLELGPQRRELALSLVQPRRVVTGPAPLFPQLVVETVRARLDGAQLGRQSVDGRL